MSYHRRVLITLFSLVSLLVATSASPPPPAGSCGKNGPFCQEGFCCSTSGFCGTTPAYCDPGNCQSQCPSSPPPPAGSCGKNGPFCQEGFCCSTSGWCGNTPAYCDPGNCQSQCPSTPPPPLLVATSASPPPAGSCGVDGPFCQEGFCCSTSGFCGTTPAYCDPGNCQSQCPSSPPPPAGSCGKNGPFCQEGFCCSTSGWCGNTPAYCDPGNCQSQCPSTPPPPLLVATSASLPPPAGSCGVDGPFCQEGFCCSTSGFCGTTPAYCDPGNCQSQCPSSPPPPAGSCGKNGPFCQEGFCCSTSGWCGNTPAYCDPGNCQSQCPSTPPPPLLVATSASPPPPAGSCGVDGPFCQEGFCCSTSGFCGTTPAYCDPGNCQSQCPSSPPPPAGSCGKNGPFCQEGFCCSTSGFCGTTPAYCDPENCQSQCPSSTPPPPPPPPLGPTPPGEDISSLIPRSLFEKMLLHRNDNACPAKGFYTYDAFITAAKSFPAFATTGDTNTRKRELAAFFAQTSHETTGGWPDAPDGPYAWGYCYREEIGGSAGPDYCDPSNVQWPCVPGKKYYGRGPIQLSYNYNYGPCGEALGVDLLSNPDLVASDTVISFKSALWFWMTPQPPKPSCHDVITENWTPSSADIAAGRLPGFGLTTNIINGGLECGHGGPDDRVEDRIGFYKRYCDLFGVSYGDNLDCYNQAPFGWGLLLDSM